MLHSSDFSLTRPRFWEFTILKKKKKILDSKWQYINSELKVGLFRFVDSLCNNINLHLYRRKISCSAVRWFLSFHTVLMKCFPEVCLSCSEVLFWCAVFLQWSRFMELIWRPALPWCDCVSTTSWPCCRPRHTKASPSQTLHCCCQRWWLERWSWVLIFWRSTGSFNALLRELVAEFTLTDNSANTTTSLLRSLCHYDDSVLMGSWLQETDHKSIEDQVITLKICRKGLLMVEWQLCMLYYAL